jgi:hypothetical protein
MAARDDPCGRGSADRLNGANSMRSVLALALGLAITLCGPANAATVHRPNRPEGHLRMHQRVTVRPGQSVTAPTRFAVPGWTDEQTRSWLDNASAGSGLY